MAQPSPFLLTDREGFTPHMSRLVSMMHYARRTTLEMVRHLSTEELDLLPDPDGNSIGMLLEHMAAVEVLYQRLTFEGRELNETELERWLPGLDLGKLGRERIRGQPIRSYLNTLEEVRAQTLEQFRQRDDAWLHTEFPWWGQTGNHYFCWFHVFEDEINHRGQIRLLLKAIPRFRNRGLIGARLGPATEQGHGLKFIGVGPEAPAGKAGLQHGDVALEYNGVNIENTLHDDIDLIGEVGEPARFLIRRDGVPELLEITVVRGARG